MSQDQADPGPNLEEIYGIGETPRPRLGIVGFLVPVLLVAALGVAALFYYKQQADISTEVAKRAIKARDKAKKFDLPSLKEAEKLYQEIIELDPDNATGLSYLALVNFSMSQHGVDRMAQAEEFYGRAVNAAAETPTRYAVGAYLDLTRGNAAKAERDMTHLLEQEKGAPIIAHALGWAKADQGAVIEGNRVLRQAVETDFSAVSYRLTLAEYAHRNGDIRGAIKQLGSSYRNNANPKLMLAKAWAAALRLQVYGTFTTPLQLIKDVQDAKDNVGPRTKGMLTWAEGELALAAGNAKGALEKADEAAKSLKDYPPLTDLKARATLAMGKTADAIALYEEALRMKPTYRETKWALARVKSKQKDDGALALIDELEKSAQGTKGAEYEIFRGEHALRKNDLEEAKARFTAAADLGDDPDILFGLARITFEEEKKKGNKADLGKVAEQMTLVLEKKKYYPEAHEYVGDISLWNYLVPGAHGEYEQAEKHYKKLKRPIPEIVAFYDRVIGAFGKVKERRLRREAQKMARTWQQKKQEYLSSILAG